MASIVNKVYFHARSRISFAQLSLKNSPLRVRILMFIDNPFSDRIPVKGIEVFTVFHRLNQYIVARDLSSEWCYLASLGPREIN